MTDAGRARAQHHTRSAHHTRVVGLMSGTSHDAIDAAAVDIRVDGDELIIRPLGMISRPYDPELRHRIAAALPPAPTTMAEVCQLDTLIGQAFAEVAALAIDELCDGATDLIVSHGQTLFHWVDDGVVRGSLQLGQPAWIAERTGVTVVADLRARDIAAAGQGAPLVSIVDALWLEGRHAAAVNLGGIANVTVVHSDRDPIAFDTGPANALIDAAVAEHTRGAQQFDENGAAASRGRVHAALLDDLLAEPYFDRSAPKSTGKELFNNAYLAERMLKYPYLPFDDVIATLTALTARTVARAIAGVEQVVLSGGGTRNPVLVDMIRAEVPGAIVQTSDDLGLPSDAKEAIAFAVLGFLTINGQSGVLPSCTGAGHASVLGAIIPAATAPARTLDRAPTRLRIEHP